MVIQFSFGFFYIHVRYYWVFIYDSDEVDFFKGSLHNQEQYKCSCRNEPRK